MVTRKPKMNPSSTSQLYTEFKKIRDIEDDINSLKNMKKKLANKEISPKYVIGGGYTNPRKVANEWIDGAISIRKKEMLSRMSSKKPVGWRKEPKKHSDAARKGARNKGNFTLKTKVDEHKRKVKSWRKITPDFYVNDKTGNQAWVSTGNSLYYLDASARPSNVANKNKIAYWLRDLKGAVFEDWTYDNNKDAHTALMQYIK